MAPNDLATQASALGASNLPAMVSTRVVGLVILVVEGRQALDGHIFDIGAAADGQFAVIVESVGGFQSALVEHARRVVLAHLELVAHHGHFGIEQLLFDAHVGHPVGFQLRWPSGGFRRDAVTVSK